MRLLAMMETSSTAFSAGATAHAWHSLTFPLAPFCSSTARGRVTCGWMNPLSQPVTCITWHYLLGRGHVQRMKEY